MKWREFIGLALLGLGMPASAVEVDPYSEPKIGDAKNFQDFFSQVAANVYVAGQPTEAALSAMRDKGVTRVISLRTAREMDNREIVPFDEAAVVKDLGMDYVHIPLGGPDTPYTAEALDRFASAIETSEGGVLLHCTVAWRASHMWAAYLVAHQGFSVADAVAYGQQMNMGGYPFAELLGRSVRLEAVSP